MKKNDLYQAAQNIMPGPHLKTRLAAVVTSSPKRRGWLAVAGMAAATCALALLFALPMMWLKGLFGEGNAAIPGTYSINPDDFDNLLVPFAAEKENFEAKVLNSPELSEREARRLSVWYTLYSWNDENLSATMRGYLEEKFPGIRENDLYILRDGNQLERKTLDKLIRSKTGYTWEDMARDMQLSGFQIPEPTENTPEATKSNVEEIYDDNGNIIKRVYHHEDGKRDELEYDDSGENIISSTSFDSSGRITQFTTLEYGDRNLPLKLTTYHPDGSVFSWCEFEYDELGRVTLERMFKADGSPDGRIIHEYDEYGGRNQTAYNADGSIRNE
jgi:hypothetical protein